MKNETYKIGEHFEVTLVPHVDGKDVWTALIRARSPGKGPKSSVYIAEAAGTGKEVVKALAIEAAMDELAKPPVLVTKKG